MSQPSPQPNPEPSPAEEVAKQVKETVSAINDVADGAKNAAELGRHIPAAVKAAKGLAALLSNPVVRQAITKVGPAVAGAQWLVRHAPTLAKGLGIAAIGAGAIYSGVEQWRKDADRGFTLPVRLGRVAMAIFIDVVIPAVVITALATAIIALTPLTGGWALVAGLAVAALLTWGYSALTSNERVREWLMGWLGAGGPFSLAGQRMMLGGLASLVPALLAALAALVNALQNPAAPAGPVAGSAAVGPGVAASAAPTGGPASPATPAPRDGLIDGTFGRSYGDPHLRTFDGYPYDFQAVGEFVLVKSTVDDFEVQVRYGPPGGVPSLVSVTHGVAVRVGSSRFSVYDDDRVLLDGKAVAAGTATLPGGATATVAQDQVRLTLAGGVVVIVYRERVRLSVEVALPTSAAGKVTGLLGDFDGKRDNDLRPRGGGSVATDRDRTSLYRTFGDSWRITQAASLLDYGPGETTETFTDKDYPRALVHLDTVTGPKRAEAERACRAAGVFRADVLADCILDVALTGDTTFAAGAAAHQQLTSLSYRLGAPVTGRIGMPGQALAYAFTGQPGQRVAVELGAITPLGGSGCSQDLTAVLVAPDGAELWRHWVGNQGCQRAYGPFTLPAAGEYRLIFVGGEGQTIKARTGSFSFSIVDVPDPEVRRLTVGARVDGKIERTFATDAWEFPGQAGQRIVVDLGAIDPDCRLDLTATLRSPGVAAIWTHWVGNHGCRRSYGPLTLPTTGTYRLEFAGGSGATIQTRTGGYSVAVLAVPDPQIRPLALGTATGGRIESPLAVDEWHFDATAGDRVTVTLAEIRPDGGTACRMDLTATLLSPSGAKVWTAWVGNSGCGRPTAAIPLPATGRYRLVFHGGNGQTIPERTGTYTFTLARAGA